MKISNGIANCIQFLHFISKCLTSFQAKTNEPKVNVGTEPPVTRKRSQRKVGTERPTSSVNGVSKRKIKVKGLPTVSIKNSPIDASNDKKDSKMARVKTVMGSPAKFILPPIDKIAESVQANKRNKRKIMAYEVDCTQINMDTTTFVNVFRFTVLNSQY